MKFKYDVHIEAPNNKDAEAKLTAAATLMQKLNASELTRLAQVVANDPVKTAIAKKALGL